MAKTVFGLFHDSTDAEYAVDELRDEGYNPKDISIIMRDMSGASEIRESTGASVAGGAVSGAAAGGVLGGLVGMLVGTDIIPGLGVLLIGGPLAAALGLTGVAATAVSGVATGLLAGGLVGALAGLGMPEGEAMVYEDHVREGAILIAVPVRENEEDYVREILEEHYATNIKAISMRGTDLEEERVPEERGYAPAYATTGVKGGRSGRIKHKRTAGRKRKV